MELQKREKEMLVFYDFANGMLSKSKRIKSRKTINEDLNDLLEKDKLSKEEYNTMHKELDKLDKLHNKEV